MNAMTQTFTSQVFDAEQALALGKKTLSIEIKELESLLTRLGPEFTQAVALLWQCQGRIVVTGMGKSGHVGRKIAATFSSTGSPAMFVHPAEASHGDLGMVTPQDVVLAISNSGESDELVNILPVIKRLGSPIIAMTGKRQSALALSADIVLDSQVSQEADPLNLAPTASTTVQLALGDALAVALLNAKGFQPEDFARSHPGGSLGRRLLTHVRDVMHTGGEIPAVLPTAGFAELMSEMSHKGIGAAAIVNAQGQLEGVFTDGDLRRHLEAGIDLRGQTAASLMHINPRTIAPDALATQAAEIMERHRITCLLVTDADQQLVGALHVGDLMRAKVI